MKDIHSTAKHRARMNELHDAEEVVNGAWYRLLPCLDAPGATVALDNRPFEQR